ncbi:MAG: hypothetical protein NT069_18155, partial [Planctomycetota bacterium]|nr:hypothetical protein [Planctomycetota bacterium]
ILHGLMAVDHDAAAKMWTNVLPDWLRVKLHYPSLIRENMKYDGPVFQGVHHRSHAASCFFPSPFERAATLTIDGVGEWATASIGRGEGSKLEILKEMRFPHSLGLLYSAFTYFTGFKVNSGEYKMMGLAPYGRGKYTQEILDNVVDLKEDGSIQLNMEYFAFLRDLSTTSEKFDKLFGGPRRKPESRITRREIDLARSIQEVTEEAFLRMARTAKKLTGETNLCLAGGVALNCVANGHLLRAKVFDDMWIQPAAGDSGCALGVALDIWHTHFEKPRKVTPHVSPQGGSYLGPSFSGNEIQAYLETGGFPYHKLSGDDRNAFLSKKLQEGLVVGHFAGRLEFGPRSLGSRSILGDARNTEMQANLNLRIKYRESFRPFAPAVLNECVSRYFELEGESPYMLIVAPVRADRRLPFDISQLDTSEDLLPIVRQPRSDLPAITHVDYSARIQTVKREHHPEFYDLIHRFEKDTGVGVVVNTSFNVRGEPIVCTPQDAYRCFMRTEMDVLALEDYILLKGEQPTWPEGKGEGLESEDITKEPGPQLDGKFVAALETIFEQDFWPVAERLRKQGTVLVNPSQPSTGSMWFDVNEPADKKSMFQLSPALVADEAEPKSFAHALTATWHGQAAAGPLEPVLAKLIAAGIKFPASDEQGQELPESVYAM